MFFQDILLKKLVKEDYLTEEERYAKISLLINYVKAPGVLKKF